MALSRATGNGHPRKQGDNRPDTRDRTSIAAVPRYPSYQPSALWESVLHCAAIAGIRPADRSVASVNAGPSAGKGQRRTITADFSE